MAVEGGWGEVSQATDTLRPHSSKVVAESGRLRQHDRLRLQMKQSLIACMQNVGDYEDIRNKISGS